MTPAPPRRAARRPRRGAAGSQTAPALPQVQVVVLNYNAAGWLERCLESLLATDYPDMDVVVVDNASTDDSADLARSRSDVTLIEAGANLGFSRGNNLALRRARAPLVALLNPDTHVEPGWLRPLVDRLQADPIAGGVGPKMLFDRDRIPLTLSTTGFVPGGGDRRELGVRLYALANGAGGPVYANRGVYGIELDRRGDPFQWTAAEAEYAVPAGNGELRLSLEVASGDADRRVPLTAAVNGHCLGEFGVDGRRRDIQMVVPAGIVRRNARPVIENAGIKPLPDGSMRDRGTRVTDGIVWHEWDGPNFAEPREVFAVKGGAALYRRDMLEALDYLDPAMFMYYEDADLCWRARRRGWRFWYEPAGTVHHAHAAISREWSPGFIRDVEFGKLRMLAKNAPLEWVRMHARDTAGFGLRAARRGARALAARSIDLEAFRETRARAAALTRAVNVAPDTARRRMTERRLAPLDGRELRPFFEAE